MGWAERFPGLTTSPVVDAREIDRVVDHGRRGAPTVVANSDCIATSPARVAESVGLGGLVRVEPPVAIAFETPVVAWHDRVEGDAAVAELRALIENAAATPPRTRRRQPPRRP